MSLADALDDGTELFEVLFERATLAVAVLDRDLRLRKFNRSFRESVRRNSTAGAGEPRVGESLHTYFPSTRQHTEAMFAPVMTGETSWHRGVPHEVEGRIGYWDLLLSPLRRDGEVVGLVFVFSDATERTEARLELERNERRFRSILRNSSEVVLVVGGDGTVDWAAPSAHRLLGLPADRPLGPQLADLVHPGDVPAVRELLDTAADRPGEGPRRRWRLRHGADDWRTFEVVPVNLLDDPDVGGIVLSARDVTERDRARAELRRRDAVLEAVRLASQRFLESQSSWRASINEVMAMLGRAASVSRVYIFENFHDAAGGLRTGQSHEWVAPGIEAQIDNPELASLSYTDLHFDGIAAQLAAGEVVAADVADLEPEQRPVLEDQGIVSLVLVPVFVGGHWWGFLGFDDCTAPRSWSAAEIDALRAAANALSAAVLRQHAEDQLREQQAQYRQVFEATGDGLVITDPEYRLVRANPAFYRMHGYRPGELDGQPSSAWVHPDTEAVPGDEPASTEGVHLRKDGSRFPVQVQHSAFAFRGRPHQLGVVRDDTDRSQAFALLEQRVRALSEVAASLTVNRRLSGTMEVICRAVVDATPALACSVYVVDDERGSPKVSASAGLPDGYTDALEQCWRNEPGIAEYLRGGTEPLVARDVPRRALASPIWAPLHRFARDAEWDTVVAVALEPRGRELGSVNAYYPADVDPSPDDLAFLRAVADQATVAVENNRLVAEAQSKAGLEERQRLARELHDSVSQALYGIALGARTARALAEPDDPKLAEPLDYVLSLAQAGMTEMRSLIFELRPESLANEGLVAALEKRVAVLRARHQLEVDARLGAEPRVPLPVKETLYRIAQEALHNVVKHAHARRVEVTLVAAGDGGLELRIVDDGVGFDPAHRRPGHLGLQSMRERVAARGGSLRLDSAPGSGTRLRVRIPLVADPG
jgi:PAS domain S-box-containing protein